MARYADDPTQGPACAQAAGAATIYRNYLAPVAGAAGQARDRQIDCLADLAAALGNKHGRLWRMQNGYALFSEAGLAEVDDRLAGLGHAEREGIKGLLRIGTHWDVDVTDVPPGHRVSQAFCSALPIGYHDRLGADPRWERVDRLILEAAYEATLLAALIRKLQGGSGLVYLTRIGGGVFRNPKAWIDEAIRMAVERVPGPEVRIVSFGPPDAELRALVL